ncbi:MAG: hypothetical protein J6Y80_07485 [Victivallales bacterium]|nr:hypothetical protein [Victivallales bacterium]
MAKQVQHGRLAARGSMALEYVVTLCVGIVLFCCWLEVYTPGAGYTEAVGKPMVAYFQRILVGISMPIP